MGVRLAHGRPVGNGRTGAAAHQCCTALTCGAPAWRETGVDALRCSLHVAAWLPIGHVDGERLETVVARAGAESARCTARAARR